MATTAERMRRIKPVPAPVQYLDKQLQSADTEIRQTGLDSIHKMNVPSEPLTDCLARLMEHQNWYVRQAAADGVVRAAQVPKAVEVALRDVAGKRMETEDIYTRSCASRALVGVVQKHLAPDEGEKEGFVGSFSTAGPGIPEQVAAEAASQVAQRLTHEDPRIVQNAVEALTQMGECAAPHAPQLGACIANPDVGVRNAIIRAFKNLGVPAAGGADDLGQRLAHEDPITRRAATRALLAMSHHSGAAAAAGAAAQLKNPDPIARQAAAACLATLGPLAAPWAKHLSARLEDDDTSVRITAVRALVNGGPSTAPYVKHVKHRMNSEDPEVRAAAVDAMRGLARVCPVYAKAVGKMLAEDAEQSGGIQQRVQALKVLAGAEANAQPYLTDIVTELQYPDWAVRRAAIEALQDLKEHAVPVASQVARRVLHHEPDTRRAAAEALGLMGIHSAGFGDRLVGTHATEEDQDVKAACAEAIDMLTKCGALTPKPKGAVG